MPDVLQISLGTTHGLRVSDARFATLLEQAGASVETVGVRIGLTDRLRRAYPVNDLVEAAAARRATESALRRVRPRALVFSTTTAALLVPDLGRPYAGRLDSPAVMNRPGARNAVLHALERRRLAAATLVLPTSTAAAAALPVGCAPSVVVPVPVVVPDLPADSTREPLAIAYTPDPKAKGLDILCRAWALAEKPHEARLEVFGIERERALRHLRRTGVPEPAGVRWRGLAPAREFHGALARCRAFITSARWEDFGMTQLEALALGALLVCTATEGPFEARGIAAELKPELVAADQTPDALSGSISRAFALDERALESYRAAAGTRLGPYAPGAVARTVAERVLPALL
ncbi:MAG TPA: glycosyltransferase [Solirubrobacteraceae bacterium]|nr:glycosyltransferase [Solirubrobacteraceae bacterium]